MRLQALGSGSNGNCFVMQTRVGTLIIDAGISRSRIMAGLKDLKIPPSEVKGILITHAHGDHINGLAVLHDHLDFHVIATPETIAEIRKKDVRDPRFGKVADRAIPVPIGATLMVDDFKITLYPAIHDIAGSCGFHIEFGKYSLTYTTDTGEVIDEFQEKMRESDYIVIESNHDKDLLLNSRRPIWLKRRIRDTHLSNDETLDVLRNVITKKTKMVALAHLSGECNSPEEVMRQIHGYHLDTEAMWNWVVCTRDDRSSLVSRIKSTLQFDGGLHNQMVNDLDLTFSSVSNVGSRGLDNYF